MHYTVVLNSQDLEDFLNGNEDYMEQYRAELERRLNTHGDTADVSISRSALTDKIDIDGEHDELGEVGAVMADMANDWSWLLA